MQKTLEGCCCCRPSDLEPLVVWSDAYVQLFMQRGHSLVVEHVFTMWKVTSLSHSIPN